MSPGLLLLVMDVRGGLGRAILKPPSPINVAGLQGGGSRRRKRGRKELAEEKMFTSLTRSSPVVRRPDEAQPDEEIELDKHSQVR
jgi:hypothetical protein